MKNVNEIKGRIMLSEMTHITVRMTNNLMHFIAKAEHLFVK